MTLWPAVRSSENTGGPYPPLGRETFAILTSTARSRVWVLPAPRLETKHICSLGSIPSVQDQSNHLHMRPWIGFGHFLARSYTLSALPPNTRDEVSTARASFRNTKQRVLATFKSICIRQWPKEIIRVAAPCYQGLGANVTLPARHSLAIQSKKPIALLGFL